MPCEKAESEVIDHERRFLVQGALLAMVTNIVNNAVKNVVGPLVPIFSACTMEAPLPKTLVNTEKAEEKKARMEWINGNKEKHDKGNLNSFPALENLWTELLNKFPAFEESFRLRLGLIKKEILKKIRSVLDRLLDEIKDQPSFKDKDYTESINEGLSALSENFEKILKYMFIFSGALWDNDTFTKMDFNLSEHYNPDKIAENYLKNSDFTQMRYTQVQSLLDAKGNPGKQTAYALLIYLLTYHFLPWLHDLEKGRMGDRHFVSTVASFTALKSASYGFYPDLKGQIMAEEVGYFVTMYPFGLEIICLLWMSDLSWDEKLQALTGNFSEENKEKFEEKIREMFNRLLAFHEERIKALLSEEERAKDPVQKAIIKNREIIEQINKGERKFLGTQTMPSIQLTSQGGIKNYVNEGGFLHMFLQTLLFGVEIISKDINGRKSFDAVCGEMADIKKALPIPTDTCFVSKSI